MHNMKFIVVLSVVLALGAGVPHNLVSINEEDFSVSQDFDHSDDRITGFYSWRSPEGQDLFVRYVADSNGYRVVDSNALPTTVMGAKADGTQSAPRRRRKSNSRESDELNSKEDSLEDRHSFEDNSSSLEDKRRWRNTSKLSRRRPLKKDDDDDKKVTKDFGIADDDDDDLFNQLFPVFF